jgi:Fic family protein
MHQVEGYSTRAGQYLKQVNGYRAFIPKPLPPDPPLNIDSELLRLLSEADLELGRLDGATDILSNPGLFVAMYVRKEAVLSSQIEGTQASLVDVLEYEANVERRSLPSDVGETANYVKALNLGLAKLEELPLCNRLLREIHEVLMQGVRGEEKAPGEFRQSQNWIGMPGCDLSTATFIPPPPHEVQNAMGSLELYLHNDTQTPVLIKFGLVHGQFETIHPFLDGNGCLGRLLVTFLLCE